MRFLPSPTALAVFALSVGATAASLKPRQIVDTAHGVTVQPSDGSVIVPGTAFPFDYENRNYCESGYSPISVYMSATAPTSANVTNDGTLADGSFVFHFGDFLIANFGLPPMETPPPSTLTPPTLSGIVDGMTLFFSVVETYRDCPGNIPLEFGLETTTVIYN
ncbi:hypothetical protein DICSQDRAFT_110246 [Dichomitus squalens LYAD-421 SS1]|uniref:Phosphatidylglycerol/phosphatidylinositol transfer protein n=1 Tax=Dichomitus squalens (strain LYAD-421) TaxID=732165 RepID=R7SU21_DICSQ|nr:uncharacterized protein DICSQDRAFT_110246 [Dichomitus squalens LYAD-421 SS1]EJF58487.1 hypothetical protein DICSQDRAFT_110246 [Dichomitus squalens LYAD-421 SS1]